jgi:methyltransferase family protein
MADQAQAAAHWDAAYAQGDETRSWFEEHPDMSLRMLGAAGVSAADAVIDVGGGASPLTRTLLDRGFGDLTVLDISAAAIQHARDRLGPRAGQVHWPTADVLSWHPRRRYQTWHDRAVFHFLTAPADRLAYRRALEAALMPGGTAIIASFALDGPERCSGLPVQRYAPETLAVELGPVFRLMGSRREEHLTPAGKLQRFQYSLFAFRPD